MASDGLADDESKVGEAPRGLDLQSLDSPKSGQLESLFEKSEALVVGISKYTGPWTTLPGVSDDIRAVSQALVKLGFRCELALDIKTQADLMSLVAGFSKGQSGRQLVYLAGHGHRNQKQSQADDYYFVLAGAPSPSDPDFIEFAVRLPDIVEVARHSDAMQVLYVLDICFSGGIAPSVIQPQATPDSVLVKGARTRQFITAGTSRELVPDQSIFRRTFLRGLEGVADFNTDGFVTGAELGMYVQDEVINSTHGMQKPWYGKIPEGPSPDLDRGDFLFHLSAQRQGESEAQPN
jgi:hypothetical protein